MGLIGSMLGQNIIDQHFLPYKNQDNFTTVHVSSKAFELTSYFEVDEAPEEFQEFKDFLGSVNSFDLIAGQEVSQAAQKYQAALNKVGQSHEELMTITETDGAVSFYVDESGGVVDELVMVAHGNEELVIFSLTGSMDIATLSKMSRLMNTNSDEEDDPLQKLFTNHELKIYPNPVVRGQELKIEVPLELANGKVSLLNMNGQRIRSIDLTNSVQNFNTNDLAPGNYILEVRNEKMSVKRKIAVR